MPGANIILSGCSIAALAVAPIAVPFAILGALERRLPAGRQKTLRGWWLNLRLSLVYLSVPTLLGGLVAALVAAIRHVNGGGLLDLDMGDGGPLKRIAGCVLFLAAWDFFYYWWHRAQHMAGPLWALHKLHHLDESLGVSTQMRCHWLEEFGRIPFICVPMALLFNLPVHSGFVAVALTAWSAFIHANLRLGFGRWSAILAGPQVHRIHHSRREHHFDRNFAAFFPVYDVMFGTYYHPSPDEYPPTGVPGEAEVASVWQAALLPFRRGAARAAGAPVAEGS